MEFGRISVKVNVSNVYFLSGAIRDISQSYDIVLYLSLGFDLLGTTLFLATIFARKLKAKGPVETPKSQDNYNFNTEDKNL